MTQREGGGGVREVGTVTGGMAIMPFDARNRPYTRADFLNFVADYKTSFSDREKELAFNGLAATAFGVPLAGFVAYRIGKRLPWHRFEKFVPFPWFPKLGRAVIACAGASIPYVVVQQWFVSSVLALNDRDHQLAFHLKRLMVSQRSSLIFERTATREVTREEQAALGKQATDHALSNRMANRPQSGGKVDVNLSLGQQVLTPIAQTGYKPLPKTS